MKNLHDIPKEKFNWKTLNPAFDSFTRSISDLNTTFQAFGDTVRDYYIDFPASGITFDHFDTPNINLITPEQNMGWQQYNYTFDRNIGGRMYINGEFLGRTTYQEAVLADNPVAYYPLNERDIFSDVDE